LKRNAVLTAVFLLIGLLLAACDGLPAAAPTSEGEAVSSGDGEAAESTNEAAESETTTGETGGEVPEDEESIPEPAAASFLQPVQITGSIEVSNDLIIAVYFFENFVYLEDLTGFINRDFEYEQPLEAQIIGPVSVDEEGSYSYTLNLPAQPISPLNDVDNDGAEESGIQVWMIVMTANLIDNPFLGEGETAGWSTVYTSAHIDSENRDEIDGGRLLVWSPDSAQEFPTGFGDDGLLFTEDDPVGPLRAGYTLVDLDTEPFGLIRDERVTADLMEGDIVVNDFSEMGWTEAFDALYEKASREYPFTEMKGIDWQAIYDEFAPRIADAEAAGDEMAYYLALQDFSWSIPDGHVGIGPLNTDLFTADTDGGYGMAIHGLSDGAVIVNILSEGGPADRAGIEWGAAILEWNGLPIEEALAAVVPWSSPFSSAHSERTQQYRYLVADPLGAEVEVTFQNPGAAAPQTVTLVAEDDGRAIFSRTSAFYGFDFNALPVEYEILDSGYGYIAINSLSEDINLTIRLWEFAIRRMIDNAVPGIIIDLRHNTGGAPIGTYFAGMFVTERIDLTYDYYYSDKSGEFESYRPVSYVEPDDDLYYDGNLAVLVSPACSSACEDVAYVLGQLEQTRVIGYYPTDGIFGEVGRGQYELPGGYSFQIPTGMTKDLDGHIIIEGMGVEPDVYVPRTLETMEREYVLNEDVVLDFATQIMDQPLGAGIEPAGPPEIAQGDFIELISSDITWLDDIVRESYTDAELQTPGTRLYTAQLSSGSAAEVLFVAAWCTSTAGELEDNLSKITWTFTLNGEELPADTFGYYEDQGVVLTQPCAIHYGVLSNFPVGEHILISAMTFSAPLNDGFADYEAGDYVSEYHLYVPRP
jgi:C-terminal processing protease CtpA/Prc